MTHGQDTTYCDVNRCMPHRLNGRWDCKRINHAMITGEDPSFDRPFQSPYGILYWKLKLLKQPQLGWYATIFITHWDKDDKQVLVLLLCLTEEKANEVSSEGFFMCYSSRNIKYNYVKIRKLLPTKIITSTRDKWHIVTSYQHNWF